MSMKRQRNSVTYPMTFLMVLSSDGKTKATGLSPVVKISKNGGLFTDPHGAVTEIGNGMYAIAPHAMDRDTLGEFNIYATAATAQSTYEQYDIVATDPYSAGVTPPPIDVTPLPSSSLFSDVLFPKDISYGSQGGPMFDTSVVKSRARKEQRNRNRYAPTWKWDVLYGIKTASDYAALYNFFLVRAGKWASFRFEDRWDHALVLEPIGTGDGVQTVFQAIKTYSSGDDTLVRTITKLAAGTVHVFVADAEQLSGYSVDLLNGIIKFDAAPAVDAEVTLSATFHVPARFDIDYLPSIAEAIGVNEELILRIESIPVVEAPGE